MIMKQQLSLIISAGKGCFTCCKGCYQFFGNDQISTNDLLLFIENYKNHFGLNKITLAGGDPLARKDILYLVNELHKMNINISMDTVGKPFIGNQITIFNQNDEINYIDPKCLVGKVNCLGIPLDGSTTKQINMFRQGVTLDEIIDILNKLAEFRIDICINTVVHKGNVNDLYDMYKIISQFKNVKKWQLFQYTPTGILGYNNRKMFEIDEMIFQIKIKELLSLIKESNILIEAKSNSFRKLNYLLVNSDGVVWQPNYDIKNESFASSDVNSQNYIIGKITDYDIIKKIDNRIKKIQENNIIDKKYSSISIIKELV